MEPKDFISAITQAGKTEAWIADEVNRRAGAQVVTQPTINRIKLGRSTNPSYRVVDIIRSIHAEVAANTHPTQGAA